MRRTTKKQGHRFYHVWTTQNNEEWAYEIEPISEQRAKKCESCDRTAGVFFRDASHAYNLKDRLTIRANSPTIQCYQCWIENDSGPFVCMNRKGETVYSIRSTIMFAASNDELIYLVRRWKGGGLRNREIGTPYGPVVVHASDLLDIKPQRARISCPSCHAEISLQIAALD